WGPAGPGFWFLCGFRPPCRTCYSSPKICSSLPERGPQAIPPISKQRGAGKFPKVTKSSGRGADQVIDFARKQGVHAGFIPVWDSRFGWSVIPSTARFAVGGHR